MKLSRVAAIGMVFCLVFVSSAFAGVPTGVLFEDNFDDNSIDFSKWTVQTQSGSSVVEQNQRSEFTVNGSTSAPSGARLQSVVFATPYSHVDFSGQWLIPSGNTAEFEMFIYDSTNSNNYFKVAYRSWNNGSNPYIGYWDSGAQKAYYPKAVPTSMTDFSLRFNDTGWEFWQGGSLLESFASTTMSNTDSFFIKIGAWDASSLNQKVYFDNIKVVATPEPVSSVLFLLGGTGLVAVKRLRRKSTAKRKE